MLSTPFIPLPVYNLIYNEWLFRTAPPQIDAGSLDTGMPQEIGQESNISAVFYKIFSETNAGKNGDILLLGQGDTGMQMFLTESGCQRQKCPVWGDSETEARFFWIQIPAIGVYPPAE